MLHPRTRPSRPFTQIAPSALVLLQKDTRPWGIMANHRPNDSNTAIQMLDKGWHPDCSQQGYWHESKWENFLKADSCSDRQPLIMLAAVQPRTAISWHFCHDRQASTSTHRRAAGRPWQSWNSTSYSLTESQLDGCAKRCSLTDLFAVDRLTCKMRVSPR